MYVIYKQILTVHSLKSLNNFLIIYCSTGFDGKKMKNIITVPEREILIQVFAIVC